MLVVDLGNKLGQLGLGKMHLLVLDRPYAWVSYWIKDWFKLNNRS